ncbi:hypothetical protein [Methanocella sp. MCL-LM]|uniref:hypothetical protein n=1 Tax=Methanocella sp. MCL-LM TaxID=3412035 RepID=UPI003C77C343
MVTLVSAPVALAAQPDSSLSSASDRYMSAGSSLPVKQGLNTDLKYNNVYFEVEGPLLYVANETAIDVVDTATSMIVDHIYMGEVLGTEEILIHDLCVNYDNTVLYVFIQENFCNYIYGEGNAPVYDLGNGYMCAVDPLTKQLISKTLCEAGGDNKRFGGMKMSPNFESIYLFWIWGNTHDNLSWLDKYSISSKAFTGTTFESDSIPRDISVAPDGQLVYVAEAEQVLVFDAADLSPLGHYAVVGKDEPMEIVCAVDSPDMKKLQALAVVYEDHFPHNPALLTLDKEKYDQGADAVKNTLMWINTYPGQMVVDQAGNTYFTTSTTAPGSLQWMDSSDPGLQYSLEKHSGDGYFLKSIPNNQMGHPLDLELSTDGSKVYALSTGRVAGFRTADLSRIEHDSQQTEYLRLTDLGFDVSMSYTAIPADGYVMAMGPTLPYSQTIIPDYGRYLVFINGPTPTPKPPYTGGPGHTPGGATTGSSSDIALATPTATPMARPSTSAIISGHTGSGPADGSGPTMTAIARPSAGATTGVTTGTGQVSGLVPTKTPVTGGLTGSIYGKTGNQTIGPIKVFNPGYYKTLNQTSNTAFSGITARYSADAFNVTKIAQKSFSPSATPAPSKRPLPGLAYADNTTSAGTTGTGHPDSSTQAMPVPWPAALLTLACLASAALLLPGKKN